ncbi:HEAT repeat domain-containing protein [Ralstonia nicotianae]|nr:hypothetical protein RPSD_52680 [Ralstonia solanacearum]
MADARDVIKELIAMLNRNAAGVDIRAAAAEGLGYAGGPEARDALVKIMNDGTAGVVVRSAAARALGRATQR